DARSEDGGQGYQAPCPGDAGRPVAHRDRAKRPANVSDVPGIEHRGAEVQAVVEQPVDHARPVLGELLVADGGAVAGPARRDQLLVWHDKTPGVRQMRWLPGTRKARRGGIWPRGRITPVTGRIRHE